MSEAPPPAAPKKSAAPAILVVIFLLVGGAAAWYYLAGSGRSRTFETDGRVTFIDYETRQAEMEMPDPKGGTAMSVPGTVPENCVITVNGKPATLQDVRVGDRVRVTAEIRKWKTDAGQKLKEIVPHSVDVVRPAE